MADHYTAHRGVVEGAAEARADGEQPGAERADEVLARARRHDRVVRAGHLTASQGVQNQVLSSQGLTSSINKSITRYILVLISACGMQVFAVHGG